MYYLCIAFRSQVIENRFFLCFREVEDAVTPLTD